jgi:hypothetical protein
VFVPGNPFQPSQVQKHMGKNLKVSWAKFSTLSWAVSGKSVIAWHRQKHPNLESKTRPRFFSVSISWSMTRPNILRVRPTRLEKRMKFNNIDTRWYGSCRCCCPARRRESQTSSGSEINKKLRYSAQTIQLSKYHSLAERLGSNMQSVYGVTSVPKIIGECLLLDLIW